MAENDREPLRQAEKVLEGTRERFALEIVQRNSSKFGEESIFHNGVAGIKVRHSQRDGEGLHVLVAKLVDGEFPPHPGTINEETELRRFDIRDIASVRIDRLLGALSEKIRNNGPLTATDIDVLLTSCCSDVLMGDFSVFRKTSRLVKDRARRLAL